MDRLDPKLDIVFKLLFTRNPDLLSDLLQGVLERPVRGFSVLDAAHSPVGDKPLSVEIRVVGEDGSRTDVDLQMRSIPALRSRLVHDAALLYGTQPDPRGGLIPKVVVAWMVEPLMPPLDRLHSVFELRERESQTPWGDQLAVHVIELSSLASPDAAAESKVIERWARFFADYNDDAAISKLAEEEPTMDMARHALDLLSAEPAVRRLARDRVEAIRLYKMHLSASREDGRAQGHAEGKLQGMMEMMAVLLEQRFGPLSPDCQQRLEEATAEQIDAWVGRVVEASTVDEVLATSTPASLPPSDG